MNREAKLGKKEKGNGEKYPNNREDVEKAVENICIFAPAKR